MRLELLHGVEVLKTRPTCWMIIEEAQLGDYTMGFAHVGRFSRGIPACLFA